MEQQNKEIVGRVSFANGEKLTYTDAQAYIRCIEEELPYRATSGFDFETLTDDPKTRKAVDDLYYDHFGEDNPRPLEDYYRNGKPTDAEKADEIGIRETGVPVGLLNRKIEPGFVLEDGTVLLESERDENGYYVGGAGMDGMYLKTRDLYKPCMDAQGGIRAFQRVNAEGERSPDRSSVKAKSIGLKKAAPQHKPKQHDRTAR